MFALFRRAAYSIESVRPLGGETTIGLLLPDGSLEIWDSSDGINFTPRHGEYRGELTRVSFGPSGVVEWITPDRLKHSFRTPFAGAESMRGRLLKIRDFNATLNSIVLNWDATFGRLLSVTGTANSICQFLYNPGGQLTSATYLGWTATFTYSHLAGANRFSAVTLTGPAAYASLPTTWSFHYRDSGSADPTNGLLERIVDPRVKNDTRTG